MKQETSGVELRALLREAFIRLGDEPASESEQTDAALLVGPIQRSAEDRARTRQMVLEELARRVRVRQAAGSPSVASRTTPAENATQTQQTLFPLDVLGGGERRSSAQPFQSLTAPRIRNRACGDIRELVSRAYKSLSRCVPEDHVLVDPEVNGEFIARCRLLGADVPEVRLNRTLLNNRKTKRHVDVLREPVRGLAAGVFERIHHAVEIAASLVQRKWFAVTNVVPSVDDMLCHPDQRSDLNVYARALHDHVDPMDCHLALLAFRKSGREASARSADRLLPERCLFAPLKSLDPDDVPMSGGVYRVLCKRRPVFVSSTVTLRARLREHLERGKEAFLPESLPFRIEGPLSVEVFKLPEDLPRSSYDALTRRLRLKLSEDQIPTPPDLNWRESGALFGANECVVRVG